MKHLFKYLLLFVCLACGCVHSYGQTSSLTHPVQNRQDIITLLNIMGMEKKNGAIYLPVPQEDLTEGEKDYRRVYLHPYQTFDQNRLFLPHGEDGWRWFRFDFDDTTYPDRLHCPLFYQLIEVFGFDANRMKAIRDKQGRIKQLITDFHAEGFAQTLYVVDYESEQSARIDSIRKAKFLKKTEEGRKKYGLLRQIDFVYHPDATHLFVTDFVPESFEQENPTIRRRVRTVFPRHKPGESRFLFVTYDLLHPERGGSWQSLNYDRHHLREVETQEFNEQRNRYSQVYHRYVDYKYYQSTYSKVFENGVQSEETKEEFYFKWDAEGKNRIPLGYDDIYLILYNKADKPYQERTKRKFRSIGANNVRGPWNYLRD